MINILESLHSAFYFKKFKKNLICFDPQIAYIYYKNYRLDLITNKKEDYKIEKFISELKTKKIKKKKKYPHVYHFFYEFGYILNNLNDIPEDQILVIQLVYKRYRYSNFKMSLIDDVLESDHSKINFDDYRKGFDTIQSNLKKGNCYQVNFTSQEKFNLTKSLSPEELIYKFYNNRKNLGAYAHHSYIPNLNRIFLSNSPECLFQVYKKKNTFLIHSLPIKGSVSSHSEKNKNWLMQSEKNQGELYMIIDLLRNDLSKIEGTVSKVLFKKKILKVPGLFHLYSRIQTRVSENVTLYKILVSLFPGGSVTGAPKKSVMKIITDVENSARGFYCGSTYLDFGNIKTASINIRSAEVDTEANLLSYGSGGGVTIKSNDKDEFEELQLKTKSFTQILNKKNK